MIKRILSQKLNELRQQYPIVALLGPRQSGKTTLAKNVFAHLPYVSLEDPDERMLVSTDPRGFLTRFKDGVIVDEAQHVPELFSYLQTHVDLHPALGRFVLTGSQNFLLHAKISQSLAGRVAIATLLPFSLKELQTAHKAPSDLNEYITLGSYPRVYHEGINAREWQKNYIKTYIEKDVRQLKNISNLGQFQTFLKMCAHRIGQLLNLSALAQDCGISHNTAKEWLGLLEASYLVFLLRPHHRNYQKRLIKMPKIYFCDTGLVCALLGIDEDLYTHPLRGPLFENFVVAEMLKTALHQGKEPQLYFWRDHVGHEVDLIQEQGQHLIAYELKSGQTLTADSFKGLEYWLKLSGEEQAHLVYAGEKSYDYKGINVIPWRGVG
jgi:predicted AAA+ superfamily ATPase